MDLKPIFEKINFAQRYRTLCDAHQDFDNRLRGIHKPIYESVLRKMDCKFKYYSKGSFYQIINENNSCMFMLNLVLKDGLVESLIYININDSPVISQGRFDFLPEDMNIPFERKRYNLPIYVSEEELKEILKEIFSIYDDIKKAVLESQTQQ
jgi:hypothetical protein